jgi:hypothetical protein
MLMGSSEFEKGELVSFIKGGMKQNGTVEYILDNGDVVVKPHLRYRDDNYYIFPKSNLKKLLQED